MKRLLYIFAAVAITSCGSEKSTLQDVLGNGHFRGNTVGDNLAKVAKQSASDNIIGQDENAISCEFSISEVEILTRYDFDEGALYSIQADLFFTDSTVMNTFQNELIDHYNSKFGKVDEDGGFLVWQDAAKVELTLADESIEFGQPKLSLTIYNFDY